MPSVSIFTSIINQCLPEPHAGLLSGIVFGVKTTLDSELKQALIATGTLHIVALSGMNITILTNLVNTSLLWFLPRKIAIVVTLVVIIGFVWFVGPSVSIIRAAIMGVLSLVGVFFGRPVIALWSWGIAVIGMLIVRPLWITDLSFQLSVLASLGMILFGDHHLEDRAWKVGGEPLCSIIHHLKSIVNSDLRATLAAQTLTIPLLFFTFGRISFISPLTNVLIVWTLPVITVLGFLVSFGGFLWLPIGHVVGWVAWIFLEYVIFVIEWTSRIPFASVGI